MGGFEGTILGLENIHTSDFNIAAYLYKILRL